MILADESVCPHAWLRDHERRGIPFGRLVEVEGRKLLSSVPARVCGVALAVATPVLTAYRWSHLPERALAFPALWAGVVLPLALALPMVGILVMTGEVDRGTDLTTYLLTPRRGRLLAAKSAVALLVAAGWYAEALVAAWLGALLAGRLRGAPGGWQEAGPGLAGGAAYALLLTGCGVAFGVCWRRGVAALLAVTVAGGAVVAAARLGTGTVATAAALLDPTGMGSLLVAGDGGAGDWERLVWGALAWVLLPLLAGAWLERPRTRPRTRTRTRTRIG